MPKCSFVRLLHYVKCYGRAEFEDYEDDDIIMDQIYNLYNSGYEDAKISALLAYAFRKKDWYDEYPSVSIVENGYEGDDEDDNNLIVRPPFWAYWLNGGDFRLHYFFDASL